MKKVIFICRGNMHRSPTAEALYNFLKKDDSIAESYGTMVEAEGRTGVKLSSYPEYITLINYLKKHFGIDISNHASIQITPKLLEDANKIVVMCEEAYIPDWLKKYNYEHWNIVDDFSTPEILEKDVKTIKEKVENLNSTFS